MWYTYLSIYKEPVMQVKYTIEDIKQRLLPEIVAIKSTLLTKGFIVEGNFTSINHMILYKTKHYLSNISKVRLG